MKEKIEKKKELTYCEEFLKVLRIIEKSAAVCGANSFNPNYKPNIVTYILFSLQTTLFFSWVYSLYLFVQVDLFEAIKSVIFLCAIIQGLMKFFTGVLLGKFLRRLKNILVDIYTEYQEYDDDFKKILKESNKRIKFFTNTNAVFFTSASVLCCLFPIYYLVVHNKKVLPMTFQIPGVNEKTDIGFTILLISHLTIMIVTSIGIFAADNAVAVFVLESILFVDIINLKVKGFNERLNSKPKKELIRNDLLDIIKMYQLYADYSHDIAGHFHYIINSVIVCYAINVTICLLMLFVQSDWNFGIAYLFIFMSGLYYFSIVGTASENAADRLIDIVYEIDWYRISLHEQRLVQIFLMLTQKKIVLHVGGFLPLSVSTALQITKMIYSFMTFLLNFAD